VAIEVDPAIEASASTGHPLDRRPRRGKPHPDPTALYLIVKDVFSQAADTLAASDLVTAADLRRASAHWSATEGIETSVRAPEARGRGYRDSAGRGQRQADGRRDKEGVSRLGALIA
jgi:hypothetical protein